MSALLVVVLEGEPLPWQRTRDVAGRKITDKRQRLYQQALAWRARAAMGARRGWEPDARFELAVRVYVSKRNADLDNYVKQACDSLVKAGALVDDRRIDRLTAERWVDRARPRLECELAVLVEVA